VGEQSYS